MAYSPVTFKKVGLPVTVSGQTVFVYSPLPNGVTVTAIEINGVGYNTPVFFTLSGNVITWLSSFRLELQDELFLIYA
jgi:hypothetical protein